ncbi:hypothetical protein GCM10027445_12770 [Amycolatopsis endophytica]
MLVGFHGIERGEFLPLGHDVTHGHVGRFDLTGRAEETSAVQPLSTLPVAETVPVTCVLAVCHTAFEWCVDTATGAFRAYGDYTVSNSAV